MNPTGETPAGYPDVIRTRDADNEADGVRGPAIADPERGSWRHRVIANDLDTLELMIQIGGQPELWLETGRKPLNVDETAGKLITHLEKRLARFP